MKGAIEYANKVYENEPAWKTWLYLLPRLAREVWRALRPTDNE